MMKKSGFTLVEILITVTVAAIFIPAIGTIFSLSLQSSSQGENFSKAYALAQQGMEEIFQSKSTDPSWSWTAVSTSSNPIPNTVFTREIIIADAFRCGVDSHLCDCSILPIDSDCPGTVNNESRKILVKVTWPERNQTQEVKLEAYVTKH